MYRTDAAKKQREGRFAPLIFLQIFVLKFSCRKRVRKGFGAFYRLNY